MPLAVCDRAFRPPVVGVEPSLAGLLDLGSLKLELSGRERWQRAGTQWPPGVVVGGEGKLQHPAPILTNISDSQAEV